MRPFRQKQNQSRLTYVRTKGCIGRAGIQRIPTEVSETLSSNALQYSKSIVNMLPETRRFMGETGWHHQRYPAQHVKEHPVNNKVTHQATRNKVTSPATWSSAQKSNMEQEDQTQWLTEYSKYDVSSICLGDKDCNARGQQFLHKETSLKFPLLTIFLFFDNRSLSLHSLVHPVWHVLLLFYPKHS